MKEFKDRKKVVKTGRNRTNKNMRMIQKECASQLAGTVHTTWHDMTSHGLHSIKVRYYTIV